MRLCSYVVKTDVGFVPNPFWGFCTCAACTPNHQGLLPDPGDWLLGNSSAETGAERQLIYAMQVSEPPMDFDAYYRDRRFANKKARDGSWRERCGDNIYFRDDRRKWKQARAFHHVARKDIKKDLRRPRVFISNYFFYFGECAPIIPVKFASLVKIGRGCSRYHEGKTVRAFVKWLEGKYPLGVIGQPRDRDEDIREKCGSPDGRNRQEKQYARTSCRRC